jgi:hypothetical protein
MAAMRSAGFVYAVRRMVVTPKPSLRAARTSSMPVISGMR